MCAKFKQQVANIELTENTLLSFRHMKLEIICTECEAVTAQFVLVFFLVTDFCVLTVAHFVVTVSAHLVAEMPCCVLKQCRTLLVTF